MNLHETWFAVVNPSSANGKTKYKWPALSQAISRAGINLEYSYTSFPGEGTILTRKAIGQGYTKIIAVGGDGTVNEVINGLIAEDKLIREDTELAVLGHGTGSDFIRMLKPQKGIDSLIQSLQGDSFQIVDLGKVVYQNTCKEREVRYFINASNLGIGAEVVNRVNQRSKRWGSKLTYFSGTLSTILNYKNVAVTFQLDDGKELAGSFTALMICNGQYIGGGMQIAPQAQLNDGMLDVIVVKDTTKFVLFSKLPLIYHGRHIGLPEIETFRCRSLRMMTPENTILETDGEIIGYAPSEFSILPGFLKLRV